MQTRSRRPECQPSTREIGPKANLRCQNLERRCLKWVVDLAPVAHCPLCARLEPDQTKVRDKVKRLRACAPSTVPADRSRC
jgi:hypothetical protein